MHFAALVRVGVGLSRRLEEQQVWSAGQRIGNIWSRLTCILLVLAEAHIHDLHFYNDLKNPFDRVNVSGVEATIPNFPEPLKPGTHNRARKSPKTAITSYELSILVVACTLRNRRD